MTGRVDPLPLAGGVVALAMVPLYLLVVSSQGNGAALWVVVALVVAGLCATYGAVRRSPQRLVALGVSTVLLVGVGVLGILSIGLPLLVAGALCLTGLVRSSAAAAV
ncbi:MAG: hypothetical protein ABI776_12770 [Nocardioidaceae bacterium]